MLNRLNIALAGGLAATLSILWAGSAVAASEDVLSDSNSVALRAGTPGKAKPTPGGVEISLDEEGDGGEKFLYLKGEYGAGPADTGSGPLSASRRTADGARSGAEVTGLVGTFTPSHGNVRFGFANRVGRPWKQRTGFDIALDSSLATGGGDVFDTMGVDVTGAQLGEKATNLSLSLGYAGFNVDAGFLSGSQGLEYGYRGYDVGLGYQRGNWGTILGFSGVTPTGTSVGTDLMGTQSQYTMRLGAFYQVLPGLTLGGRFQFHDYTLFDSEQSQNRGELFLNTKLNF